MSSVMMIMNDHSGGNSLIPL